MTMEPQRMTREDLEKAISFATERLRGKVAKDGTPSVLHSLSVMIRVSRAFSESCQEYYVLCIVAVLHDVVEDCDVTLEDIESRFGSYVSSMVGMLTRKKGEKYSEYIEKIKVCQSIVVVVKYHDMKDNLERCRWLTGEEKEYLVGKYTKGIALFEKNGYIQRISEEISSL